MSHRRDRECSPAKARPGLRAACHASNPCGSMGSPRQEPGSLFWKNRVWAFLYDIAALPGILAACRSILCFCLQATGVSRRQENRTPADGPWRGRPRFFHFVWLQVVKLQQELRFALGRKHSPHPSILATELWGWTGNQCFCIPQRSRFKVKSQIPANLFNEHQPETQRIRFAISASLSSDN